MAEQLAELNKGNNIVYSTTERVVGTWHDGRKIYEKSMSGTVTTYSDSGTRRSFSFTPITGSYIPLKVWGYRWGNGTVFPTKITVENMIRNASASILITGYSLSEYFSELVDEIVLKSQRGVFVKFFVNDIERQTGLDKILRYKGRFLKVYNYPKQSDDKMAALHAKVISTDKREALITSANLSYHGQEGNLELGTYIESPVIAQQIDDVFTQLIFKKVFVEV